MFNLLRLRQMRMIAEIKSANTIRKLIFSHCFSTKVAVVDSVDKELEKTIENITYMKRNTIKKKPQKPPFAKNLFLGVYDTDILAYPEVLDKSTVEALANDIVPVKDFFEDVNRNEGLEITTKYLENLYNLKLLGLQVPNIMGGRQLTVTETCRFYEEMAKADGRIGIIQSEQFGVQTLLKHGNDHLKKYLNDLIQGKSVAAICINEHDNLNLKAVLSKDEKHWILNGSKSWVVNGQVADIFIVICETEAIQKTGMNKANVTSLLVHRTCGGISTKPCEMLGLQQTNVSDVTFENTKIPVENEIGDATNASKIISSNIPEFRLTAGPLSTTILRKVVNNFLNYCVDTKLDTGCLADTEAVQAKIGTVITNLYAIESLTYLTSSLMDEYENQDCELETAITKVFSVEKCSESILDVMKFVGPSTFLKNNIFNKLYRHSLGNMLLHESVDNLKIIIALLGLQHAGINLSEKIRMLRNPLYHASEMLKRVWTTKRQVEDNPKLNLCLHEYLHPSLHSASQYLEYCVLRLQFATETLLARHGHEVINQHVDLKRLADSVIDIYAITAVLGRASRAYCIGLQHADQEVCMATAFSATAMERVKDNVNKICKGPYSTATEIYLNAGKYAVTQKHYFPVNPLTRNF